VSSSEAFIPAVSIAAAGGGDQNASPSVARAPFSSKEAPENQEVRTLYGSDTHQVCSSSH